MRILICGDRDWSDRLSIDTYIAGLPIGTTVIHGAQRGADRMAGLSATARDGLQVQEYPANWARYGRAAGPIRNQQMLTEGKPDLVAYFHHDLAHSKGTKDMVKRATRAGVTTLDVYITQEGD